MDDVTLSFHDDPGGRLSSFVSVRGLRAAMIDALQAMLPSDRSIAAAFRVTVIQPDATDDESLPAIVGRYRLERNELQFFPHFPFVKGVAYRAIFDNSAYGGRTRSLEFSLPPQAPTAAAKVANVFPTSDCLPENLLRFYVCFSAPMQRGTSREHITILTGDGRPVPDVLYRAPVELWDRSMTCLTVLLDPGRLKRSVGPNRALGPPLVAGQDYSFVVGAGMLDSTGRPIRESHHKRFHVTDAVREPVKVEQWLLKPPTPDTRRLLEIVFPQPLDRVLLTQSIRIVSTTDAEVDGQVTIDQGETRWRFTPTSPWVGGDHWVQVLATLEDVCGNSVDAAFDRQYCERGSSAVDVVDRSIEFRV